MYISHLYLGGGAGEGEAGTNVAVRNNNNNIFSLTRKFKRLVTLVYIDFKSLLMMDTGTVRNM